MNSHPLLCKTLLLALLGFFLVAVTAHGSQLPGVNDFRNSYPLKFGEIKTTLSELAKLPVNPDPAAREREAALNRLKAYRFLCSVPYKELKLDAKLNEYCAAAAKVMQKLNKLDHNPPNPGMPEAEYQLALEGAKKSNLAAAFPKANLLQSVDMWMNDSDAGNIVNLGHRRWCLSPNLGKTGFGAAGIFSAMWSVDFSNPSPFDIVYYPAKGFMPVEYFRGDYAWSVSPNPQKYSIPGDVDVKIFPVDISGKKTGAALPLNYKGVSRNFSGSPLCVVFRPDKSAVAAGKLYLVEISGVMQKGAAAMISYPVEFVSLAAGPG